MIDWEEKDCPHIGTRCIKEYCLAFEIRGRQYPRDNKERYNYCRVLEKQLGETYIHTSTPKANEEVLTELMKHNPLEIDAWDTNKTNWKTHSSNTKAKKEGG